MYYLLLVSVRQYSFECLYVSFYLQSTPPCAKEVPAAPGSDFWPNKNIQPNHRSKYNQVSLLCLMTKHCKTPTDTVLWACYLKIINIDSSIKFQRVSPRGF